MRYGLALGSGGIRGVAHPALIERLMNKRNINFDVVTGCSAGAVTAALFALEGPNKIMNKFEIVMNKYSKKLDELSKDLSSKINIFAKLLASKGIAKNDIVYDFLTDLYGNKKFSDCKIKLGVVSVDINSGKLQEITEGYIVDAVMASSNVPGAFVPQRLGGMNLIDGGVLNEVPVELARKLGAEYVIANHVSPIELRTKFKDGMDYMSYIDNFKIDRITKNSLKKADEYYEYKGKYMWFEFNKYMKVYEEGKELYGDIK
ncbi:patatin [Tepiditoga spiralis]|uniref:Patatin n=1 Tax=Tepiditoga spiralis TaxID=2108365 RepID=A0A7G1GCC5_9BACT|nr:patatin-like phospholipase family protein [Tepiditoga spiralis]BBE32139.1 patatin [Tepiditoga spiralis]